MVKGSFSLNKLPGKTEFSGRRRAVTRSAGFLSHPDSTGGEYKIAAVQTLEVRANECLQLTFDVPATDNNEFAGFGAYFCAPNFVQVNVDGGLARPELSEPDFPNWSKVGSMWVGKSAVAITVSFTADKAFEIAIYGAESGAIRHKHLEGAKSALLKNMHRFSPEANFYSDISYPKIVIDGKGAEGRTQKDTHDLYLKSCNRCARFLPINVENERNTLSFSNHCVAAHRRPCNHGGFGLLRNPDTGEVKDLEYGFQLECRFCKKFEVNAAHNPQRSVDQMKEDAQRRRAFEALLSELLGGSALLVYRHETGKELPQEIWKRFSKKCFNCSVQLPDAKQMHLDHTRPLALLWPLDNTATALCGQCNSSKRDRSPVDFYKKAGQLESLSKLTGIALADLTNPGPNPRAIELVSERLEWLFEDFLQRPEFRKERDGKIVGELVVKALQKAINAGPEETRIDVMGHYEKLREA